MWGNPTKIALEEKVFQKPELLVNFTFLLDGKDLHLHMLCTLSKSIFNMFNKVFQY